MCTNYFSTKLFLVASLVCTVNSIQRYPSILPKCCEPDGNLHPIRNSKATDIELVGSCGTQVSEIVLLPRRLFPSVTAHVEHVEVELRELVNGLHCKEGSYVSLLIDLTAVEAFKSQDSEMNKSSNEFTFSGDNYLSTDGNIYSPHHFCISSRTTNKTHLNVTTCKQKCSSGSPCIPRCCWGHQSILISPPTSSNESFLGFCSPPALQKDSWNPLTSKIVGRVGNQSLFYMTRYVQRFSREEGIAVASGNCRLLRFSASQIADRTPLTILRDGRLQLKLENTTELIDDFCIDGMNERGRSEPTGDLAGNVCEARAKEEIVVAYVCSPSSMKTSLGQDELTVSSCGCLTRPSDQLFNLTLKPDSEEDNKTRIAIAVRLLKKKTTGGPECPEGYEDSTVQFTGVSDFPFSKDGSIHLNGYLLDQTQFCIESVFHNAVNVRSCKDNCSQEKPCVNHCCSGNTHVNLEKSKIHSNIKCEVPSADSHPILKTNPGANFTVRTRRPYGGFCRPVTPNGPEFAAGFEEPYKLMSNGDLMKKWGENVWKKVSLKNYCFDTFLRLGQAGQLVLTGNPEDIFVYRCWKDIKEYSEYSTSQFPQGSFVGLILSSLMCFIPSLFYVGIAVVYILRKDKESVFRWSIVCYTFSTTFIFWEAIVMYDVNSFQDPKSHYIRTMVINRITSYASLFGLCWMSVLSFDLWVNITFLTPGNKSKKRLWSYAVFSFIVPTAAVGAGAIVDILHFQELQNDEIIPEYRVFTIFWYGLFGVLASINFILFIATAVKLWISQNSSEIKRKRKTFQMYFKLFLLMGSRSMVQYFFFANSNLSESSTALKDLGLVFSALYVNLHPILFFYFLVWNEDTKRYMENKHPRIKRVMDFIDWIGYPVKKCLRFFRCCKRSEEGTIEPPHNSTHMYVHTTRTRHTPN